jgi:hypothetical protein
MEASGQLQAQAALSPEKNSVEAGRVYWGVLSRLEKFPVDLFVIVCVVAAPLIF